MVFEYPLYSAFLVLFLPLCWAAAVVVACRLLADRSARSVVTPAFLVWLSCLVMGLLPLGAEVQHSVVSVDWEKLHIQPVIVLGCGGSFAGLAIALVCRDSSRKQPLGRWSLSYFVLVAFFNLCGVVGNLIQHGHESAVGLPMYAVWLVSSFATNLVLQKIVVARAALIDNSKLPRCLRWVFCCEVLLATILLAFTLWVSISAAVAIENPDNGNDQVEEEPQSHEEWEAGRRRAHRTLLNILFSLVSVTYLFMLLDLLFSVIASWTMWNGLRKIQKISNSNLSLPSSPATSGINSGQTLESAIFFAMLNLALVIMSVTTTTLYYFAFSNFWLQVGLFFSCSGPFYEHWDECGEPDWGALLGFIFMSWLLDSLFNDACVAFVGFGPTGSALKAVGEAASADVIGKPAALQQPEEEVAGTVVGVVTGSLERQAPGRPVVVVADVAKPAAGQAEGLRQAAGSAGLEKAASMPDCT